jgi:CRP/FNR family transcriptional regulator, cyclic AMP receptor protein
MARHSRSALMDIIGGVPLFSQLNARQRREVAKLCFEEAYAPGQVIIRQLEDAQFLVVILEGSAQVTRDDKTIATVGPGDAVGEMSLIDGMRRSASVVAETEVQAVILHRTAFLKLLDGAPTLARNLLLAQTARLRDADKKLSAFG